MWPYLLALLILCSGVTQAGKFVYLPPSLDTWAVCNGTDRCSKAEDAAYDASTWEVVSEPTANDTAYIAQRNGTRDFESQLAVQLDTSCNYLWVRAKGDGILWLQKTPFGSVPSNTTASILFNGETAVDWQWTMIGSRADENLQRVPQGASIPVNDVAQRDFTFTNGTTLYILSTPDVQLDSLFCSTNINATPVSPGGGTGVAANYSLYEVTTEPTVDDAQWNRASVVPKTGFTTTPAADMVIQAVWKAGTPSRLCVRGEETLANLTWIDVSTDASELASYTAVFTYVKMNNLDRVLDDNTWLLGVSPQPDYYDAAWPSGTFSTTSNLTNVSVSQSTSGNRHRMEACFDAPSVITTGNRWLCDFRQNERITSGSLKAHQAFNPSSSVSALANWGVCAAGPPLPASPGDTTPPLVGAVTFSTVTSTGFTVTATASDPETGISACAVVYDDTNDNSVTFGVDSSVPGVVSGGSCSVTVTGLAQNTAYEAAVYAVNGVGLSTTGPVGDQTTLSNAASTFYISATALAGGTCTNASPCSLSRLMATSEPRPTPGETWILKNGTYNITPSNAIALNCAASGGNAINGTASLPITVQAETERQAWLKGDGAEVVFKLSNCSYWVIRGLRMSAKDNNLASANKSVMQLAASHENIVTRNLLHHSNRYGNNSLLLNGGTGTEASRNNKFIENEFYYFARYALISKYGSGTVARRNYCNSRGMLDLAGHAASNPNSQGDGCIQNYPHSNGIYENNISESSGGAYFVEPSTDSVNNIFLGNIDIGSTYGALMRYKPASEGPGFAINTLIKNFLSVSATSVGFYARGQQNMVLEESTIYGNPSGGLFVADVPSSAKPSSLYNVHVINTVAQHGTIGGTGFSVSGQTATWNITAGAAIKTATPFIPNESDSHITGEVVSAVDQLGNCRVWVPPSATSLKGTGLNGEDIGATILYAYTNGVLSNTTKLWDSTTGAWLGAGAPVSGSNPNVNADVLNADINTTTNSAADVGSRLNILAPGCLPVGY